MTEDQKPSTDPATNREVQPEGDEDVLDAQDQVDRLKTHDRQAVDDQGIAEHENRGGSLGGSPPW